MITCQPIVEVPSNACPLRMGLALFGGEDAGEDPDRKVVDHAQSTRGKVKGYITILRRCDTARSMQNTLIKKVLRMLRYRLNMVRQGMASLI